MSGEVILQAISAAIAFSRNCTMNELVVVVVEGKTIWEEN